MTGETISPLNWSDKVDSYTQTHVHTHSYSLLRISTFFFCHVAVRNVRFRSRDFFFYYYF